MKTQDCHVAGLPRVSVLVTALLAVSAFAVVPPPGGTPDYFGSYSNYANSPQPMGGAIMAIAITAPGAGYLAPVVTITDTLPGVGSGATATATADPVSGAITAITITSPGSFYSAPVVAITDTLPGLGTGATATATASVIDFTYKMRKFIDTLPTLLIATPDIATYPGSDYYEIELVEYTSWIFHTDLINPTQLRGYRQTNNGTNTTAHAAPYTTADNTVVPPVAPSYLGPTIIATKDRPVRIKFTNRLPIGASGNLFIPTDISVMGAGMGPDGTNYPQNRGTLHLHGGFQPWISDGTPHQWVTPAGEDATSTLLTGVSTQPVPDMPLPSGDSMTFYWPNQQGGRLQFYHDHAYGITRLNVYAGEAAGYLIVDPVERSLTNGATAGIPAMADVPLVIQDKTFVWGVPPIVIGGIVTVPGTGTWATDPTWNWGQTEGSLWFPHVYMPNQHPMDLTGANMMGRWDYALWFWPPYTGLLNNGELPNPYYDPINAPWESLVMPGTPNPSLTPESFMDTPVVNGKAYPTWTVNPQPYRLRILNACNDRFMNLSLWTADPLVTTSDGRLNTEVKMVPFNSSQHLITPFPAWWYTPGLNFLFDDRVGGVPDPTTRGPAMVQIGSEGGLLPGPAVIRNQPVNYTYNRRNIVVLNVEQHALFLGPAERADVIVDFTQFAGKTLILYNDSPAPVPAADQRLDYYTGCPDQTGSGGAPTTLAGFGPNTRTIMQIVVSGAGGTAPVDYVNPTILAALKTALPTAFAATQDPIIVPQQAYKAVYPTIAATTDALGSNFSRIQDTSMTIATVTGGVADITVVNGGTKYSANPTITISDPTGTGAAAKATVVKGIITAITLTSGGTGYTAPTVAIADVTGTGASATASLKRQIVMGSKCIQELFEINYGRMNATLGTELPFTNNLVQTTVPLGYIDPPTEFLTASPTISAPMGGDSTQIWKITHNGVDTHAIHFHLFNVQVINRIGWDGAVYPPDENERGWKETVRMNPLQDIVVAMRPTMPLLPFGLPNSVRPLDVTVPLGSTGSFSNINPATGNPITPPLTNVLTNFYNEYVWHCHLLGHEENDMMRPMVFNPPEVRPGSTSPLSAVIVIGVATVNLTWTDATPVASATTLGNPTNEIGFQIQRATNNSFSQNVVNLNAPANSTKFADTTVVLGTRYYYRVRAYNAAGNSNWSNTVTIRPQ